MIGEWPGRKEKRSKNNLLVKTTLRTYCIDFLGRAKVLGGKNRA